MKRWFFNQENPEVQALIARNAEFEKERQRAAAERNELQEKIAYQEREKEMLAAQNTSLNQELQRVYAGHRGMEEEIDFLKFRITTLDDLHESVVQGTWPHDGSLKKYACTFPFERIEILPQGEVYTCCSAYLKHNYYIGNINTDGFEDIWNSEKAQNLRKSVATGNFEYCQASCKYLHDAKAMDYPSTPRGASSTQQESPLIPRCGCAYSRMQSWKLNTLPRKITLSCDESCNLACSSCRSAVRGLSTQQSEALYQSLMKNVRPLLRDCELLSALGSGDIFASRAVSGFLASLQAAEFPKLKLFLITNLQLFDAIKWEQLPNLHAIPIKFSVSVDGACKATYETNRRGGTWERLQKNLHFLCELKNSPDGKIESICLNMVVQENNFREMDDFVSMAEELGADYIEFQKFGNWGTFSPEEYARRNVADMAHEHHGEFMDTLHNVMKRSGPVKIIENITV